MTEDRIKALETFQRDIVPVIYELRLATEVSAADRRHIDTRFDAIELAMREDRAERKANAEARKEDDRRSSRVQYWFLAAVAAIILDRVVPFLLNGSFGGVA